jgi:hypothetical protein
VTESKPAANPTTPSKAAAPEPAKPKPIANSSPKIWEVRRTSFNEDATIGNTTSSRSVPSVVSAVHETMTPAAPAKASFKTVSVADFSGQPKSIATQTQPATRANSSLNRPKPASENQEDDADVSSKYNVGGKWK